MNSQIIDGRAVAESIRADIAQEVGRLRAAGTVPGLVTIVVGDNPASLSYVKAKQRACEEVGIASFDRRLPEKISNAQLLDLIDACNADPALHGILVQLPLPPQIDQQSIIERIDPRKDVDGFHPMNLGGLVTGQASFSPCTPLGVVELLRFHGIKTAGNHAVIVGRSLIVGRPLSLLLTRKQPDGNATVTICHSATRDLKRHTKQADILIAAIGSPNAIDGEMVKEGVAVIDVGVNRVDAPERPRGYRLCGDVDFESVAPKASFITPVPGGVGPMTIAMLLRNTLHAARNHGTPVADRGVPQ